MVSSTTPRLDARWPPLLATHRTIISRSPAATSGSRSFGTRFRSSGEWMVSRIPFSGILRSPHRHKPDDPPERVRLATEEVKRGDRLPAQFLRLPHRRLHPHLRHAGDLPASRILAYPLPHLLEASGLVQDVVHQLEQDPEGPPVPGKGLDPEIVASPQHPSHPRRRRQQGGRLP